MFRIGFDIGSTTAKMVVLDENGNIVFSKYERHNAKVKETVISFLKELLSQVGDEEISIRTTGSIGMGVSEKCAISCTRGGSSSKSNTEGSSCHGFHDRYWR